MHQGQAYPEIYLTALNAFGVSADQTVVLEDSTYEITSALADNLRVIIKCDDRYDRFFFGQSKAA